MLKEAARIQTRKKKKKKKNQKNGKTKIKIC